MVDIWLEDVAGLPNHLNWRVIASPGHTPESLCLYNPFSYELICGDTVVTLEGGATLVHGSAHQRTLERHFKHYAASTSSTSTLVTVDHSYQNTPWQTCTCHSERQRRIACAGQRDWNRTHAPVILSVSEESPR